LNGLMNFGAVVFGLRRAITRKKIGKNLIDLFARME
jgi:hypothetical protein